MSGLDTHSKLFQSVAAKKKEEKISKHADGICNGIESTYHATIKIFRNNTANAYFRFGGRDRERERERER